LHGRLGVLALSSGFGSTHSLAGARENTPFMAADTTRLHLQVKPAHVF